jgi:hypothetical protein
MRDFVAGFMAISFGQDGKIHKPVKFGNPFDSRTVVGRTEVTTVRRAKLEFFGYDLQPMS